MSPEERRQWRLDRWRRSADDIAFVSAEAEASYKAKIERMIAVYNVEEPDRVPVSANAGMLPAAMVGLDYHTAIYHPEEAVAATRDFNRQYAEELDTVTLSSRLSIPARTYDLLDNRLYSYPGHGMPKEGSGFQYVEGEYMRADEYDAFLRDPSDFWLRTYLPRVLDVFAPLTGLQPLTDITEMAALRLPALARPEVQSMLQRLLDAGKELARWAEVTMPEMDELVANGLPLPAPGVFAKAPYDTLGDTLRGTRGIVADMLRQPDKLLQALDVVADLTIASLLGSPMATAGLVVDFPLHKGADGWMSEKQFLTFYWPTLKRVVDALVEEGLIPALFAEGGYNTRLDLVDEFPKGAVHWKLDRTDMARAKKTLGRNCSISGNLPASTLNLGTPKEVDEACRGLIETCAPGGGYVLAPGAIPDLPKLENLRAMAQAARKYGAYA